MSQYTTPVSQRKRLSLSVYIPLLLALTATIPLLATVGSIVFLLRPALTNQISADMKRDAQTRIQLIDTYLSERLNDIRTLSESKAIKNFLLGDPNSREAASDVLFTAQHRDVANYISISLLDPQNQVMLSYPTAPLPHGKYLILPEALKQLQQSGNVFISDVFYDQIGNNASVDLYARVIDNNFHIVGVLRASLGLRHIWEPVDSETQANGPDSYATILDENGVRIAYTNPDHAGFTHPVYLFQGIAGFSSAVQQRIKDENLYGNSSKQVSVTADQSLANIQSNPQAPLIFQMTPTEQTQVFEVARYSSTVVPWTYLIFKPLNVVTGLADQQLYSLLLIVALVLLLAIMIGLITGRRIAVPILRSVSSLRKSSQALKTLSDEEHTVATEQSWMVEASQVALESVKYYTNATSVAAQHIHKIGTELSKHPPHDSHNLEKALEEIVEAATYIQRAIRHQENMNEKLETALRVTTQATEQLTVGAKSTDDSATELEHIVGQLTSVVGE